MSVDSAFDAVADIGGDLLDSAVDVGSSLSDLGSEFLDAAGDWGGDFVDTVGSFAGDAYESVGSFAGNADFFNTNFLGDIVSQGVTTVTEFAGNFGIGDTFSGITNSIAGAVSSTVASLPSFALPSFSVPGLSIPGLVNTAVATLAAPVTRSIGLPSLSTPGFGSGIGYGASQPSLLGSIVNTGTGLVNTVLSGLVSPAQAQTRPSVFTPGIVNTQVDPFWANIPSIDITGVGINTGNVIAQDPSRVTADTGGFVESGTGLLVLPEDIATTGPSEYREVYNEVTERWDVINTSTNQTVASGLSEQEAILASQDLAIEDDAITLNTGDTTVTTSTGVAFDDDGNLLPGYELDENNDPVYVGFGSNGINLGSGTNAESGSFQGLLTQARQQQTIRDQRQNRAQASDWRVRLRLAPQSNYLYNDPNCGPVLWPLRNTDGVIFPYTPAIDTAYKADYESYNLTHSNYRGYFYKGSYVDAINVRAMFTAQDTSEANYLLGVIHFFRSATKMFYGQDAQRGSPPPLVYLSGLGDFQFNEHPCVIAQFNYTLPSDVDYIRAQTSLDNGTNLLLRRNRQTIAGNPLSYALQRLATVGLSKGAEDVRPAAPTLGLDNPTYVPTKMDINLTLYPMQSREQVSKQFSLRNFANGNLLKGGFW